MAARNIPTAARVREILHYNPDTGEFTWIKRGPGRRINGVAGTTTKYRNRPSRAIGLGGKVYRCHQLAWLYMTGTWPVEEIDHINENPLDNRWCNLRAADHPQNCMNRNHWNYASSGYRGIKRNLKGNKWVARICARGKRYHLGTFVSIEDAYAAYLKAAQELHGEFVHYSLKQPES